MKNPILLDFPLPIKTSRLLIRPMMPGDGKRIFEAIEESRAELRPWFPWSNIETTWEECEKTARKFYADFITREAFHFVIFNHDRFVGGCALHKIYWDVPSATIGYWCRISEQGKGYIREAIAALTVYGFRNIGFKKLAIFCDNENTRSVKVAQSLNFTLETMAKGLLPNHTSGSLSDELRMCSIYTRFDAHDIDNSLLLNIEE